MPEGFSFEKAELDDEKVLFDGVKSADPPINSGNSFTKKSRHAFEHFLVAIGELFLSHSDKKVLKLFSKSSGKSPLILLLSSADLSGYFSS